MRYEEILNSSQFRKQLKEVVLYTKSTIEGTRADFDGELPYNELTVGMNLSGEWNYQTGDNSFTGGAYGFPCWATVSVHRRSKSPEIVKDIIDQLMEAFEMYKEVKNG